MTTKKLRKQYSDEFKEEALMFAAKIGVAQSARELAVYESQLYYWRSASQKKTSSSESDT